MANSKARVKSLRMSSGNFKPKRRSRCGERITLPKFLSFLLLLVFWIYGGEDFLIDLLLNIDFLKKRKRSARLSSSLRINYAERTRKIVFSPFSSLEIKTFI